jgi:hypothetical protein
MIPYAHLNKVIIHRIFSFSFQLGKCSFCPYELQGIGGLNLFPGRDGRYIVCESKTEFLYYMRVLLAMMSLGLPAWVAGLLPSSAPVWHFIIKNYGADEVERELLLAFFFSVSAFEVEVKADASSIYIEWRLDAEKIKFHDAIP